MNKEYIEKYLQNCDQNVLSLGKKLYENNAVKKVFEIKDKVYRAVILVNSLESKVIVSLKDDIVLNCECQEYRMKEVCPHTVAVLYSLLHFQDNKRSVFVNESVDQMVYHCSLQQAFDFVMDECRNSRYHREFFKFLFYILKDRELAEHDYQYLFDYAYALTNSIERVKTLERLNECLYGRCKDKMNARNFKEALIILHKIIANDSLIMAENPNQLGYYENHFTQNTVFIKSSLHLFTIFNEQLFDEFRSEIESIICEIIKNSALYVGVYIELKALLLDLNLENNKKVVDELIVLQSLLYTCSDVCQETTVELIFKLILEDDPHYEYFKAVYCIILFNRAYAPGNLNLELIDEIRVLVGKDYVKQVNRLAKYQGEKNNQKQLLDLLTHDRNYYELGIKGSEYPSLKHLYMYQNQIIVAHGNHYYQLVFNAIDLYIDNVIKANDRFLSYIYIYENEQYLIKLVELVQKNVEKQILNQLTSKYKTYKSTIFDTDLLINRNFSTLYSIFE